jgi:signal transduction histidine kinase
MLSNLIDNAVKYTDTAEVQITVKALEKKNETIVSVTDKGVGISESNQKQVFDKFYRVPQGNLHNVKGYGLGLYYIKDIMARQGGSVSLESQPGKGSTFTLHFII